MLKSVFLLTAFLLIDANSTEFDPDTKHPVVGNGLVNK